MSKQKKAFLSLALASLIWGLAFPIHKSIAASLNPWAFTSFRFLSGCLFSLPLCILLREKKIAGEWKNILLGGFLSGLFVALASGLQQYGMQFTSAGKTGFITGLYIVLVSLASIFLGSKPRFWVWVGLLTALVGLYFLSAPVGKFILNQGDAIVLIADIFWAAQVLILASFAPRCNLWLLTFVQTLSAGVIALIIASFSGWSFDWIQIKNAWPAIGWGFFSAGVAYYLQANGQKYASAISSALIMQSQAIIGALAGLVFLNEIMTPRMIFGAFIMLIGIIMAQILGLAKKDKSLL